MAIDTPLGSGSRDVQASRPRVEVSLSRVGVTGMEKVIRVGPGDGGQLYFAELECFVDLDPSQAGVHMSRFEEDVAEAVDSVVLAEAPFRAETLAAHIAQRILKSQNALRAEVSLNARYPETVSTPQSERRTQEIYTLLGTAVASERGTRTLTGVRAQGMTACPCAQGMVRDAARARLADSDLTGEQIEHVLETVPIATHNQRGIGTLHIGVPEGTNADLEARDLLRIVESSMSSEIYELLKRPDELAVVEKAHANPRFVEDCVREMVRAVVDSYGELGDDVFVQARQENLETIHRHNVVAERHGTLGDLAGELRSGERSAHHLTMREWLEAPTP